MATTLYKANSTNCTAYYGSDSASIPNTLIMDESETGLTAGEKNTISTDDANLVSLDSPTYSGFRVVLKIVEEESSVTRLDLTTKGFGESGTPAYGWRLCVWNFSTVAWESLATGTASVKETLTGAVTASLPNYIDASGYVHLLAITTVTHFLHVILSLYYAELLVTYTPAATGRVWGTIIG